MADDGLMIITRRCIPRRVVLRGLGTAIALPFLDAMAPALGARRAGLAARPLRFVAAYVGNGMNMASWTPPQTGALTLSPILEPLAPFRHQTTIVSGLDNRSGRSNEAGGLHSRIQPAWLTGASAKPTEGPDVRAGVSLDQVAARVLSRETRLSSLELSLEGVDRGVACEPAFSCEYVSTLAWRDATTPLPMEADPRAVFERLFGDGSSAAERTRRRRQDRSILDSVRDAIASMRGKLGAGDRMVVDEYLEAIRRVERQIGHAEEHGDPDVAADISAYGGIPPTFGAHAALMGELLALAFRADITRVATLLMVRERSSRVFPESGVPEAIHALSHHQQQPGKLARQARLNTYHVRVFADVVARLADTRDAGGASLLDGTTLLFGSGMSDSDEHSPYDVPTLVVGGAPRGRHVRCPAGTPLANFQLGLLDRLGVPVERFGDSTGSLELVSDV